MKTCKIAIIFLLLSSHQSFCQEVKTKRWTFLVGSGVATPVGSYRNDNAYSAALYFPEPPNFLLGFDKSKSGFAKPGYYLNTEVQFKLRSGVFFLLRGGKAVNTVNTKELSDFLTNWFGAQEFQHVDYSLKYLTSGVGFIKTLNDFDIGFDIFVGYANCNYPYYKSILQNNSAEFWAQDGDQPTLESPTFGSQVFLHYTLLTNLSIGLDCSFQIAQFDYKISNRKIPGGSNIYEIEDTLKVALVNIGISLGYKF